MNVLFINPPYYEEIFGKSKVRAAVNRGIIVLGLATLAAVLRRKGHNVRILDLNILLTNSSWQKFLVQNITDGNFKPDYIGITLTTPLFDTVKKMILVIKSALPATKVVVGGPHPSALPSDTLRDIGADYIVAGEGEDAMLALAEGISPQSIDGIAYKSADGEIIFNTKKNYITDMDSLPFPALDLFDIPKYTYPAIISKKNPVASMETSRGCFSRCVFCNKNIFGYNFRFKSPARVMEEIKYILGLGFKEIHIVDDGFTTDMGRAHHICEMILESGLKFPWYVRGGIRVDRVSPELLKIMKKAGCYRVPYGIESGDPQILKNIKKGITTEQVINAVRWAKEAGMIVDGYFMIGLPGETEESIRRTISFACSLDIDYAKFAITVPLPGTEYFKMLSDAGKIKSTDWSRFNFASSMENVYSHELPWDYLKAQYDIAYKKFYYRPGYIIKKALSGIITGELPAYIEAFFKMKQ